MPSSKKSSLLPRYLLARLRVLQRPTVWKAATVPVLALVVASLYWVRPGWLGEGMGDRSPQSSKTPAPRPVAVPTPSFDPADLDIDTLPNLGTLGLPTSRSENASPSPLPTENSTATPEPLPETSSPRPSLPGSATPSASRNPFSPNYSPSSPPAGAIALPPGAVALPQRSPLGAGTATTGDRTPLEPNVEPGGNINGANDTPTPNPTPHPLESALQRQATPSSPQGNASTPLLPGTGQSVGSDRLTPTNTPLAPTLPGQRSSGSYLPQTSPPLGSTGYTLPSGVQSAPVQPVPLGGAPAGFQPVPLQSGSTNYGSGGQNGAGATRPQFGNGSFYTAPPTQGDAIESPDPEPPPFSSAGQRSRNGQINTFSNP